MSAREEETSAGPDDDDDFSKKVKGRTCYDPHEYEAKNCIIYLLRGLDGSPSWILHSSIAKQSKPKYSIAKSKAVLTFGLRNRCFGANLR